MTRAAPPTRDTEPRIVHVVNRTQWRTKDLQRIYDMVAREALQVRLHCSETSYSDPDHSPETIMFVQADAHAYKHTDQTVTIERADGEKERVQVWTVYLPPRTIHPLKVIAVLEVLFGHVDRNQQEPTLRHSLKRIRQIGHPMFAIQPRNRKRRKYHVKRLRKELD